MVTLNTVVTLISAMICSNFCRVGYDRLSLAERLFARNRRLETERKITCENEVMIVTILNHLLIMKFSCQPSSDKRVFYLEQNIYFLLLRSKVYLDLESMRKSCYSKKKNGCSAKAVLRRNKLNKVEWKTTSVETETFSHKIGSLWRLFLLKLKSLFMDGKPSRGC